MASIDSWWNGLVRDKAADLLELVLNALSNDFGRIEIILKAINEWDADVYTVEGWPARRSAPVSRREVIHALGELIRDGYAQAYRASPSERVGRAVEFSEREAVDLWYYLTPKGIEAVKRLALKTLEEG